MSEAPRQAFAYARVSTEDQAEEGLGIAAQLDGARAADADPFHLASIAAVVHALTARDGVEVPAWVHQYRAEPERIISGIAVTTNFGRLVATDAPPTCAQRGVYFEADLLDRGRPSP